MPSTADRIPYPRKRFTRSLLKTIGKLILPPLFKITVTGKENFPRQGPLIVIGNHTAAMEAVMMNIYTPWLIEMLSAADMPAERITEIISKLYGVIPLHRGSYDRSALRQALSVLDQQGVIGVFPEGGIWEEGKMQAQPGVAWLSYRGKAPVLPIGFNDTSGALNDSLKFKRPELIMHAGKVIPAVEVSSREKRKENLQQYANRVMEAVHSLAPAPASSRVNPVENERFSLEVQIRYKSGQTFPVPDQLSISHQQALAKFLHRPKILKIFRENLDLEITPLETLVERPPTRECIHALQQILKYLETENPFLLTYRFGPREGHEMKLGLEDLLTLLSWIEQQGLEVEIIPLRKYYSPVQGAEVEQRTQEQVQTWM